MSDYEKGISEAAKVLGYNFYPSKDIQALSDALYNRTNEENGGRAFFDGFPRATKKEFFDDVKYFLGDLLGAYIWSYEYFEEVPA